MHCRLLGPGIALVSLSIGLGLAFVKTRLPDGENDNNDWTASGTNMGTLYATVSHEHRFK